MANTVFLELFPVQTDQLPKLRAYRQTSGDTPLTRAASGLKRTYGGRWAACDDLLLTDAALSKPDQGAEGLTAVARYKPTPKAQAEFLIQALVPPLADTLAQALQTPLQGNFRVLQEPTFKAWAVDGRAAISIGILQRLIHKLDLAEYAATIPNPQGLVGMTVVSRSPWVDGKLLSGVVVGISGTVKEHRATLERFAATDAAKKRLERAAATEPVVKVRTFFGDYDFAAGAMFIALGTKDYKRLRVDEAAAQQASYQNLSDRAKAVAAASSVLKAMDYIADGYNRNLQAGLFQSASDYGFSVTITLGDHQPRPYAPRKLWKEITSVGPFWTAPIPDGLQLGIINALGDDPPANFQDDWLAAVKALGVPIGGVQSVLTPGLSPAEAEAAFKQLNAPDVVAVWLPHSNPTPYSSESDWAAFVNIKRWILAAGLPSVCVYEADMTGKPAAQESALLLTTVLGHVPFALGQPLPDAEYVVGLVAVPGDAPAWVTVVYQGDGVFVGYIVHAGPLDAAGAAALFPAGFYAGKAVLVHHLNAMDANDMAALDAYAAATSITLHHVTVSAAANPRLYALTDKGLRQPPTGTSFLLDKQRALMIPALPGHPEAPPNPLLVETSAKLSTGAAMRSILSMNLLHPTAKKPRLPVTLYYGERIRRLLRAGVYPAVGEGALPWWV